jgi:hypothetical protein
MTAFRLFPQPAGAGSDARTTEIFAEIGHPGIDGQGTFKAFITVWTKVALPSPPVIMYDGIFEDQE